MTASSASSAYKHGIVWSCVSRNSTILAEAGEDHFDGQVTKLAQDLMKRKLTPGWEFQRLFGTKLRGIKFHVYDANHNNDPNKDLIVWSFCCVYHCDSVEKDQAQSFLEKIVILTEMERDEDFSWRHGPVLVAQDTFAPILLQRMQEVSYYGRMAMVNEKVESCREVMAQNIELILERENKLQELDAEATRLNEMSQHFKKGARRVKKFKMWQNAKHGAVVGGLVTAGVAVLVVPPLIALL